MLLRLLRPGRRLAAGRRPDALHGSGRGARRARSRPTTSSTSSGSASRSSSSSCSRPALAAVALPQLLANALSDFRVDDRPALPQRRRGHPVPHRGDGLRDRAAVRLAPTALAAAAVLVCCRSRCCRRRALAAARRRDAARRSRRRPRPARRGALAMRSHSSRPTRRSRASNTAGAHLSARRYVYTRPAPRTRRVGRRRPRRSVGRAPRLADPHAIIPSVRRGVRGRLERGPELAKVFERDGVRRASPRRPELRLRPARERRS